MHVASLGEKTYRYKDLKEKAIGRQRQLEVLQPLTRQQLWRMKPEEAEKGSSC